MPRSAPRSDNAAYIRLDSGTVSVTVWANGSPTLKLDHPRSAEVCRALETDRTKTMGQLNTWARAELRVHKVNAGDFKPPPYLDPHLDYRASVIPSQLTPSKRVMTVSRKRSLRR